MAEDEPKQIHLRGLFIPRLALNPYMSSLCRRTTVIAMLDEYSNVEAMSGLVEASNELEACVVQADAKFPCLMPPLHFRASSQ